MKLVEFVRAIVEDVTDPFVEHDVPTSGQALIDLLSRRRSSVEHQKDTLTHNADNLLDQIPGTQVAWRYTGALDDDVAAGKIVVVNRTTIPNIPENQQNISRIRTLVQRADVAESTVRKLTQQINKLTKAEADAHIKSKQSGTAVPAQIPVNQIPDKIITGTSKFGNPYFAGSSDRYAGDAAYYPWTPQMIKMYHTIDKLLTSNGLKGIETIYASKVAGTYYNFAAIGADGKFVWRKYDVGGGSGQNVVYCNREQKMNTSSFISYSVHNPTKFDALIAGLKAP